jgi:peptide deformylase
MLDIVYYGDPILRKKAKPVTVFDAGLADLVNEMIETMAQNDGVGLAAPQVGVSKRIVTIDATRGEAPPIVLVNPEFTYQSEELVEREEGCLSFPDIHLDITRPEIVSVKAFDAAGAEFTVEKADDLLARAFLHEIDHLDGLLIIDHVSLLQRKLLSGKLKKIAAMAPGEALRNARAKAV